MPGTKAELEALAAEVQEGRFAFEEKEIHFTVAMNAADKQIASVEEMVCVQM